MHLVCTLLKKVSSQNFQRRIAVHGISLRLDPCKGIRCHEKFSFSVHLAQITTKLPSPLLLDLQTCPPRRKTGFGPPARSRKKWPENPFAGYFSASSPISGPFFFTVRPKCLFGHFYPVSGWRPETDLLRRACVQY